MILCSKPSCHTWSNAALMSKKTAGAYSLFSKAWDMTWTTRCICSMVECLSRKPNWIPGIRLFLVMIVCNLRRVTFSKILEVVVSSDIGRYDSGSSVGFPGLGITIILATFHACGTYCDLSVEFISRVRKMIPFLESSRNMISDSWSWPGALRRRSWSIIFATSSGEVGLIPPVPDTGSNVPTGHMLDGMSLTWKTPSKYWAKRVAFSESLRAHELSLLRIGGLGLSWTSYTLCSCP